MRQHVQPFDLFRATLSMVQNQAVSSLKPLTQSRIPPLKHALAGVYSILLYTLCSQTTTGLSRTIDQRIRMKSVNSASARLYVLGFLKNIQMNGLPILARDRERTVPLRPQCPDARLPFVKTLGGCLRTSELPFLTQCPP